jgi:protein-disulfide isomerase
MLFRFRFLVTVATACLLACFACSPAKPAPAATPLDTTSPHSASVVAAPDDANAPAAADRPEHALAKVPVSAADPQWGSVDAPVTIVEFSDFQCPFCSRVLATLEQLKQKYGPTRLRVVFKHNPLPFHAAARPTADTAAAVFMLAGNDAFFAFHDRAFANQQTLTPENLESWAKAAGVQTPALRAWLESGKASKKVEEDMQLARTIGATGTPGFRINGVTLSGAQPLESFVAIIDEQLAAAKQLTGAGTPPRLVYVALTNKNTVVAPPPAPPEPEAEDNEVWNVPIAADDPQRGPRDALVTVVQFSDYQCPFCKRVEATLREVRRLYGADLRIVWKDNPLPFHPRALPAAQLARRVYETRGNDAFWQVHDALFDSQPALEDDDFERISKQLGLPVKGSPAGAAADKLRARIEQSVEQAADFQARGTPHFFINGRRLSGAQPLDAFKKLIDEELTKARALVSSGTPRAKVYGELVKLGQGPPLPETKHVPLRPGAASRGNAKAPIVIQVFSDYQCPFCKRVEPTLDEIEKDFKGSVRIVWRHLPLPFHENAQAAAEASEEVLAQKGAAAFWQYHDLLFEAQADPGLERATLDALADRLGLDMARFKAALDGRVHQAKVDADAEAASNAGINGTPGFLINDYYLSGAQPVAAFRKLVRRALKPAAKP